MQDRVSLYPGRVKLTPVSDQENTYDMVRADEPTQEGTPLSKAAFLKDDTAALFGLDATALPDHVLALLSRFHNGLGNEYVWEKSDKTGVVGYVNSPDPNAYHPAVSDGYTYKALGKLGEKARIATGSYTGTGTYGSANPCSLTFNFPPKLVIVQAVYGGKYYFDSLSGSPVMIALQSMASCPIDGVSTLTFSWNGNTFSWYCPNSDNLYSGNLQLNRKNDTYLYVAIG